VLTGAARTAPAGTGEIVAGATGEPRVVVAPSAAGSGLARHAGAVLLAGLALAWLREPVGAVVALALHDRAYEHYSHIVLIPLVSLVLVVGDRRRIFARVAANRAWGLTIIGTGSVLVMLTRAGSLPGGEEVGRSLLMLALVVLWAGTFVLCYGLSAARSALFPLAFLLFMVPLPPVLLSGLIGGLQRASAETSAALFGLLGVPLYREGFVFQLPGLTIEVAEECSGIRSYLALVVTSVLAGHLVLSRAWSRTALLLTLLPLAIAKNAMRIVGLSLLAIHVDPAFVTGSALHRYGGIPLFVAALVVVAGLLAVLTRLEGRVVPDARA
jgi:exosortase